MKKIFLTLLTIGFLAVCLFGQSKISAQCRNDKGFSQGAYTQVDGNFYIKPCPTGDVLINNLNRQFKLQDIDYIPFAGSLNADVLFSNASNDNVQNNAGLITTSNHFIGLSNDLKITASGANRWHIGMFNQIRAGGAYTGSGQLYGFWNFVTNRGNLTATPYIHGIQSDINLEGNATEAIGIDATSFKGSAVTNPLFIGGRFTAANGYTNTTDVFGVQAIVRTVSSGATITNGRGFYSQLNIGAGHTVTNGAGLFIGNWINTGVIENSKAIYIDNTSNVGAVSNFALASDSLATSYFTGNLEARSGFYIDDTGTVKQVTLGANDSCGAGFKCLRVAN